MSEPTLPEPKKFLSAGDVRGLAKKSHPPIEVEVPEWGGSVMVRKLSVADLDRYYAAVKDVNTERSRATVLAQALCDASGNRLFGDNDAGNLVDLDAAGAERVVDAFFAANGIGARRGN